MTRPMLLISKADRILANNRFVAFWGSATPINGCFCTGRARKCVRLWIDISRPARNSVLFHPSAHGCGRPIEPNVLALPTMCVRTMGFWFSLEMTKQASQIDHFQRSPRAGIRGLHLAFDDIPNSLGKRGLNPVCCPMAQQ